MTVGHLAIGLAAGRVQARTRRDLPGQLIVYGILSVLPDLDFLALALGHARAVLGHRGVTHSLVFAALAAGLVALLASQLSPASSRLRTAVVAFLVLASHAVLDPLIMHSSGTALWWPFASTRFTWGTVQPIPDAFTGLSWPYFSARHLAVELLLSSPFLLYAFWPRQVRTVGAGYALTPSAATEPVPVESPVERG